MAGLGTYTTSPQRGSALEGGQGIACTMKRLAITPSRASAEPRREIQTGALLNPPAKERAEGVVLVSDVECRDSTEHPRMNPEDRGA